MAVYTAWMGDFVLEDGWAARADRYLWHSQTRTAVLSDLHLGIEESLRRQGIAFPAVNAAEVRRAWDSLRQRVGSEGRVVIAGDLFDSSTPDGESIAVARELVEQLPGGVNITLLRGNHDPEMADLRRIFAGTRASVEAMTVVADYAVIHGHQWQDAQRLEQRRGVIVGHQHPAVVLRDRVQSAKMICFAVATVRMNGREVRVMVLPTFSRAPLGTNLMTEGRWIIDCQPPSPERVRIAGIVEGKQGSDGRVLDFGWLADL